MEGLTLVHRVSILAPHTHMIEVESTLAALHGDALADAIVLFMATWTPGSYLIREYARHVEGLTADAPARATKIRKNAWRIDTSGAAHIVVRYRVYAGELTVRTSHVDATHAFLVGAALFLGVEGREDLGARVEIVAPAGWRAATALPAAEVSDPAAQIHGTHVFDAPDFDTLVDCPIELGTHREERFDAAGKAHRFAVWPREGLSDADAGRLVADTTAIIEREAKLFGGALPYDRYDLLLHLSLRGRGGLEHRASAALIAPAVSFSTRDGYLDLLSLIAHEVFHAWNVKRIRPAALAPYRYSEECTTRLLWWFEGGTSYYDWRVLCLAGLCTVDEYLSHLAGEIAYLDHTPGRMVLALEEASHDAWIKLYRPDENSPNSGVSYYRKGEVVCALLDLEVRARTGGRTTLDHILAALWQRHGATGIPVEEGALQGLFEDVAQVNLGDLFDTWIRAPGDPDYGRTLAHVGLAIERSPRPDAPPCSLGVRVRSEGGRTLVSSVVRGGPSFHAGIDAGDEIIAVGGVRAEGASLDATLRGRAPSESVDVVVARDGRLLTVTATLGGPKLDRVKIVAQDDAPPSARAAFGVWLGQNHPAWSKRRDASS
ncbi:MAG: M61 family metallopeptidase [Polyangiaceae bacterium]